MRRAIYPYVIGFFFGITTLQITAQNEDSTTSLNTINEATEDWHTIIEEMAENDINTEQWEEELETLANNPIDLNNSTKELLESIPFLNGELIENLSYYLYRYGPMVSTSELLLVEGMDARTMRWLLPFVRIDPIPKQQVVYPPMKMALKYGKQELRLTLGTDLQKKEGFEASTDSSSTFLGDQFHASIKYGFNYKGQLQWGVVLEKDPGERWWNREQRGFDYASWHLLIKDSKRKNTILFGDYNLRFGQGLVFGSAFSLGKNTSGGIPETTGASISRHFSTSETNYMRGFAFKCNFSNRDTMEKEKSAFELYTFFSNRMLDASIKNRYFSKILNTGLHRTVSEASNQKKLKQTVIGCHFSIRKTNLTTGITAMVWQLGASALDAQDGWNNYNLKGDKGGNASMDFRAIIGGLLCFGEFAIDQNFNKAMLAGTSFKPNPRMSLSILGRTYSRAYISLFGNSFSDGTSTRNENGIYISTDFQLAKRMRVSGYADVFRLPWLSYGVNSPSWGQELAAELSSTFGKSGTVKLLLKSKSKERNASENCLPIHSIQAFEKKQVRLLISTKKGAIAIKSVFCANKYMFNKRFSNGFALAQDVGYEPPENGLSATFHTVLFNTDAWENRIYLWEKDLPGAFSMPMLYGHGCRSSIYFKYKCSKMYLLFKISDSIQADHLSSNELITSSHRSKVSIQLCYQF